MSEIVSESMSKSASGIVRPVVVEHDGIFVVRDDLYHGGTKARVLRHLIQEGGHYVYATPFCGGAQTALAVVAHEKNAKMTLVLAARKKEHWRTTQAEELGAEIVRVRPGYLNVVQARAREYVSRTGAELFQFGLASKFAVEKISEEAATIDLEPDEVWCASGSGVLARALTLAFPSAAINVVEVGKKLKPADVSGAKIWKTPLPYNKPHKVSPPFSSDLHYEAKAWEVCKQNRGKGKVLFWNVTGWK